MKQTFQFTIDTPDAGRRLDELLAARLGWLSRMHIADLIAGGACTVNDAAASAGQRLSCGAVINVVCDAEAQTAMTPEPIPLLVVHEDESVIVVDKPAGMLVHPTRAIKSGTLLNALAYHLNRGQGENNSLGAATVVRPGLVHRLDRATSGLMVVAKTQRALSVLSRHFHQRRTEKLYLAVLDGVLAEDECEISALVGRDAESQPKWRMMSDGKPAQTVLRVVERTHDSTFVELKPITGRTNQLRVHCSHIGHPIRGDEWYGGSSAPRLCLHAWRLAFHHPASGEWVEFTSPLQFDV